MPPPTYGSHARNGAARHGPLAARCGGSSHVLRGGPVLRVRWWVACVSDQKATTDSPLSPKGALLSLRAADLRCVRTMQACALARGAHAAAAASCVGRHLPASLSASSGARARIATPSACRRTYRARAAVPHGLSPLLAARDGAWRARTRGTGRAAVASWIDP